MSPEIRDAIEHLMQVSRDSVPGVYKHRTAAREKMAGLIDAAILAEREACAVTVESNYRCGQHALVAAAAIRARSTT